VRKQLGEAVEEINDLKSQVDTLHNVVEERESELEVERKQVTSLTNSKEQNQTLMEEAREMKTERDALH
jgi:chromosome segregation ATPase